MNWYLRGKIYWLIGVGSLVLVFWLTEEILHLGLFDWSVRTFGRQTGPLVYLFFWIFILSIIAGRVRKFLESDRQI